MSIATRLRLGLVLVLAPILLLAVISASSLSRLAKSGSEAAESLGRYREAVAASTKLAHVNNLASSLLRDFLTLGYVSELGEVQRLSARLRADLEKLLELVDPAALPEARGKDLRAAMETLVEERSREITSLDHLREVQSSKITGVNEGLDALEKRFLWLTGVDEKRIVDSRRKLAAKPSPAATRRLLERLSIYEIERVWSASAREAATAEELRLLVRDVLLKVRPEVELRRDLARIGIRLGDREATALFPMAAVVYADKVMQLLVVAKNLTFMRSMVDQGTKTVTMLQETISGSRSSSLHTITSRLIPAITSVEQTVAPRLKELDRLAEERLKEAQALSQRSAGELRSTLHQEALLVLACLAISLSVTLVVARAVNRPIRELTEASQRVRDGDLSYRVDVGASGTKEFRLLADTFNQMSARLRGLVDDLEHRLQVNTAILRQLEQLAEGGTPVVALPGNLESDETVRLADGLTQRIVALRETEKRSALDQAVARTTQMLAHDVRKPFSMLRLGLDALKLVQDDPKHAHEFVGQMVTEVERALRTVDGLLADVMEIGARTELYRKAHSPIGLIDAALGDIFRYNETAEVTFQYQLGHQRLIDVDRAKVLRVFANILENAVQAMKGRGTIRFETETRVSGDRELVEFRLGNDGPLIDAAELPQIFDAFYTKGKPRGTGLGLAIAKKIVEAHGGTIWALSSAEAGTVFGFRLPVAEGIETTAAALPAHSRAMRIALREKPAVLLPRRLPDRILEKGTELLRGRLLDRIQSSRSVPVVLVVDDEPVYAEAIGAQLKADAALGEKVRFLAAQSDRTALELAADASPDLIICDLDLGRQSVDGLELVRQLKASGSGAHICVHSNRNGPADYRAASDAGADAFLPKPMSLAHLLQLVLASHERRHPV